MDEMPFLQALFGGSHQELDPLQPLGAGLAHAGSRVCPARSFEAIHQLSDGSARLSRGPALLRDSPRGALRAGLRNLRTGGIRGFRQLAPARSDSEVSSALSD